MTQALDTFPKVAEVVEPATAASPMTAEALCELYAARVYRFAFLVSRGDVESEDLAQDSLERAIRKLNSFDPLRGSIEAWLWRIVLSTASDAGRVLLRRHRLIERLARLRPEQEIEEPSSVGNDVPSAELVAAIRELQPRDRAIVALRYGAELSYEAIGLTLGMKPAAAGVAGRRALARLRTSLERQQGVER